MLGAGEVSSVALTESVLARIDAVEPKVQAYLALDREGALRQAEQADIRRKTRSIAAPSAAFLWPLRMSCAPPRCPPPAAHGFLNILSPPYDATVVTKLDNAGAVLLGKLAMDEFAMGSTSENCAFKVPHNPWRPGYVAGGSSGGSAAAVAADECFASLGSDTGGSIRQPASLCGTVGMKPTYGRVSRYGLVAFASSLDQVGPLTKDVRDCALMMNAISGHDPSGFDLDQAAGSRFHRSPPGGTARGNNWNSPGVFRSRT